MKKIYTLKGCILFMLSICIYSNSFSQSTPVAQALQHNQAFASLSHASAIYPAGMQGWNLGAGGTSSFRTTAPTANSSLLSNSTASVGTGGVHNYNGKVGILPSASVDPSICLAINTTGKTNIQINFDAMTIRNPYDGGANTAISGLDLQYRTGSIAGAWTSVTGMANGFYQNNTVTQLTGVTPQNSMIQHLTLPAACDNQSAVYLRWVSRDVSGTIGPNGRPSFAIDNISVCPIATPTITINGPSRFCTGQPAIFHADTLGAGASPIYQWKKNGTNIGTNIRSLTTTGLVFGDQIMCVMTSSAGCLTANPVNSNTKIITGGGSPPSITSAVVTNVACAAAQNGAVNITVSGGASPYNTNWDVINTTFGPVFTVTLGTKFSTLLPVGIGQDFYVDGVELKELFLTRGIPYYFDNLSGHPLGIATDIVGATTQFVLTNGVTPVGPDVSYTPNNFYPSPLYYPCTSHQYMGYIINLVDGQNTEDLTGMAAGKYSVIVTDQNGCRTNSTYTIAQGSAVVNGSINGSTDATCYGFADGSIDLEPSGGTGPYSAIGTGPTFTVIRETKNHSHPNFPTGSLFGYTIDGVQGKELTLMRGVTYSFSVVAPGHPFFISTSDVGGNPSSEVLNGVTNSMTTSGTLTFTPNNAHPNLLYYQCGFHPSMGYKLNIVDQLPDADLGNCMAGQYNLSVVDVNGCPSAPMIIDILEPSPNTFYYDGDGDFYGRDEESALGCTEPPDFVVDGGDCDDTNSDINPAGFETCNNIDDDCDGNVDPGCLVNLAVKMYIQGYYSSSGLMDNSGLGGNLYYIGVPGALPEDVDTVDISIMDVSPPYTEIETQREILQTDGDVSTTFTPAVINGTLYYIRIKHRNSITTWSKVPVQMQSITSYDFTTSSTQAFDDGFSLPMKKVGTAPDRWAFYNGDIDRNGAVDSGDMTIEENDANAGAFGYNRSDLNGDGGSDSLDMTIIEENGNAGVFEAQP